MARSYPSPDPFPGSASQPDREPDAFDYDVPPDPAVSQSVTPGNNGVGNSGVTVLSPPDAFPGGGQIPAGAPDSTGVGQEPRLRRDSTAGGVMP